MRPIAVFSRWVYLYPMVPELEHVLDVLMLAGVIVRGCQGQEEAMAIQVPSPGEIAFGTEIPVHTAGKLFFSVPKQKSLAENAVCFLDSSSLQNTGDMLHDQRNIGSREMKSPNRHCVCHTHVISGKLSRRATVLLRAARTGSLCPLQRTSDAIHQPHDFKARYCGNVTTSSDPGFNQEGSNLPVQNVNAFSLNGSNVPGV